MVLLELDPNEGFIKAWFANSESLIVKLISKSRQGGCHSPWVNQDFSPCKCQKISEYWRKQKGDTWLTYVRSPWISLASGQAGYVSSDSTCHQDFNLHLFACTLPSILPVFLTVKIASCSSRLKFYLHSCSGGEKLFPHSSSESPEWSSLYQHGSYADSWSPCISFVTKEDQVNWWSQPGSRSDVCSRTRSRVSPLPTQTESLLCGGRRFPWRGGGCWAGSAHVDRASQKPQGASGPIL